MKVVDLRGKKCMMHILTLEKELKDYSGEFVAITDDESAFYDIPVWASSKGIEIFKIKRNGELIEFHMKV